MSYVIISSCTISSLVKPNPDIKYKTVKHNEVISILNNFLLSSKNKIQIL